MTNPQTEARLLPCPFCGGANVKLRETQRIGSEARWHRVECLDCGIAGPETEGCSLDYFGANRIDEVAQEAAIAWNARTPLPTPIEGEVEICPDCRGSGESGPDQICGRCNGSGGVTRPSSEEEAERVAKAICQSRKFECGEGACSLLCLDQLGDARGGTHGCSRAVQVHGDLARVVIAALSSSPVVEREYDIRWQRQSEAEVMECCRLTQHVFFARLMRAISSSGPVVVHEVTPSNLKGSS